MSIFWALIFIAILYMIEGVSFTVQNCMSFWLSIFGLFLSSVSAMILAWAALPSDETIENLSATIMAGNPHVKEQLKKNRNIARIALLLLGTGFVCLIISQFIKN